MRTLENKGAWKRYAELAVAMQPDGHTVKEIAAHIGINEDTLAKALKSQRVKFHSVGRHRQIRPFVSAARLEYFRQQAALRNKSVSALISAALALIADEDMIKAVLDDNPRSRPSRRLQAVGHPIA